MKEKLQRVLGVGFLAGLAGGLITGLCARSVMWIYALCTRIQPGCTPYNTLALVGCFAVIGAVLGALFLWLVRSGPGPVELRSCLFCLLVVLTMILPVRLVQSFNQGVLSSGLSIFSAILFAVMLPIFGLSIGVLGRLTERWLLTDSAASQ
jgi:hypothetical protein